MFDSKENKKVTFGTEQEEEKEPEGTISDDLLMKIVVGLGIVTAILFVLSKFFISRLEKSNEELRETEEEFKKKFEERIKKRQ